MVPLFFVLPVTALVSAQASAGGALDLSAYVGQLQGAAGAVAAAGTPQAAVQIAASLADRLTVDTGRITVRVDLGWLDAHARASVGQPGRWPELREAAVQRLASMQAEAATLGDRTGEGAPSALREVLARPEFARSPSSIWLDSLRARAAAWIRRLLDRLDASGIGSRRAALVFSWLVVLAAVGALGWWLVAMLTRRTADSGLDLRARPPRTAAREWALRALEAARAGDGREAVRCAYRAALWKLDEQGVWSVDESRTPREYLPLLPRGDVRYTALNDLTRQFEHTWYGRRLTTPADTDRLADHLETLGCLSASDLAISRS